MSKNLKNLFANFIGKIWIVLLNFIAIPFYIKLMGAEAYGFVAFLALLQSLQPIIDMGLSKTIIRELSRIQSLLNTTSEAHDFLRTFEIIYWGISFFIGLLVMSASGLIAEYWLHGSTFPISFSSKIIFCIGLSIVFQWPIALYSGVFIGFQEQVFFNSIYCISWTLRVISSICVLLFFSENVLPYFIWQAIISICTILIIRHYSWSLLPKANTFPHFKLSCIKAVFSYTAGVMTITIISMLFHQVDKIYLSRKLSLMDFGFYSIGLQITEILIIFYMPIFNVFFPIFSKMAASSTGNNQESLSLVYHKACQITAVAIVPVSITIILYSNTILRLWINDSNVTKFTAPLLSILMISALSGAFQYMPNAILQAFGKNRDILSFLIVGLFLFAFGIFIIFPYYGVVGVCWLLVFIKSFQNIGVSYFLHRTILKDEFLSWLMKDVLAPILLVIGVLFPFKILIVILKLSLPLEVIFCLFSFIISTLLTMLCSSFVRHDILKFIKKSKLFFITNQG